MNAPGMPTLERPTIPARRTVASTLPPSPAMQSASATAARDVGVYIHKDVRERESAMRTVSRHKKLGSLGMNQHPKYDWS